MKRFIALLLALVMVFALCACGNTNDDDKGQADNGGDDANVETIELKLGHPLAPTSSQHIYLQKWADLVYEQSNGKYKITIYPSSQFGEARELVESLSMGVYDIAWCDTAVMDFLVPEINLINMPFFFDSYEQLWTALDGGAGDALREDIEEGANIHALTFFSLGARQIFSNREPVTSLDSIKNLKFRVPELDLWINTFKTIGMNPTPVAWSELYNALATGVVDGGCANWEYIAQQKFYSEAPYILESNHFFQCGVPGFNLDFWNNLSAEDQQMFTDTCAQVAAEQRADVESKDAEYKAACLADGATVTSMTEFADTEEVYSRYSEGLWKDIVAAADADDLYQLMLDATGRT